MSVTPSTLHSFSLLLELLLQSLFSVHLGEVFLLLVVDALFKLLSMTLNQRLLLLGGLHVALKSVNTVLELLHILSAIFDILLLLKADRSIKLGFLEIGSVLATH